MKTLSLLANFGDDAKLLAGGQSLVPLLALRLAQPSVLIDLNGVRELDYIHENGDALSIGAMTRHRTLERSALAEARCPLLRAGIAWVGHPQIRNRGTIGGSLVHADPAAELPALAAALGATCTIVSRMAPGERYRPTSFSSRTSRRRLVRTSYSARSPFQCYLLGPAGHLQKWLDAMVISLWSALSPPSVTVTEPALPRASSSSEWEKLRCALPRSKRRCFIAQ